MTIPIPPIHWSHDLAKRKTGPAPAGATERPVVVIPDTASKKESKRPMPVDRAKGKAFRSARKGNIIAAITRASFHPSSVSGRVFSRIYPMDTIRMPVSP